MLLMALCVDSMRDDRTSILKVIVPACPSGEVPCLTEAQHTSERARMNCDPVGSMWQEPQEPLCSVGQWGRRKLAI